jgi:hypothetical protein
VGVEAALQWCGDGYSDNLVGFVNSVKTLDGGTHLDGLKAALTRTLNAAGRRARAPAPGRQPRPWHFLWSQCARGALADHACRGSWQHHLAVPCCGVRAGCAK